MSEQKFKVAFINYGPYLGCSGVHMHFLANVLVELGHECTVFLPNITGADVHFGKVNYQIHLFAKLLELPVEYFENTIIHSWTTREPVRACTDILRRRKEMPYVVHLEDNEVLITGEYLKIYEFEEQKSYAQNNPEKFEKFYGTHPLHFERFMLKSYGVTCIMKELEEFVPKGVMRQTFWPACEDEFFAIPKQRNMPLRKAFEVSDDAYILVYPGAVHALNVQGFIELLYAVEYLNNEGIKLKIIRTGIEYSNYTQDILDLYTKHVSYVENINASELPKLMAVADILVQPGKPGDFDNYRFPSKIPFFLASGRPVILPNTNVAKSLKHGVDCFLTQDGKMEELVKYLKILIEHPELANKMGIEGRKTAKRLFSWHEAAKALIPFYEQAMQGHAQRFKR